MSFTFQTLAKLNSLTKYPPIPTYHILGEKGMLTEDHVGLVTTDLVFTEKIDGTNGRIVLMPDDIYLIGSREEFLHARHDLVYNPSNGIVDALKCWAEVLVCDRQTSQDIVVFFLEVYGGKIGSGSKQYTSERRVGARLFDIAVIPPSTYEGLFRGPIGFIASWRDMGSQHFVPEEELLNQARIYHTGGLGRLSLTPRLEMPPPPKSISDTLTWLQQYATETQAALDIRADGFTEGVVVRTRNRSQIVKLRFEDYQRTLRKRGPPNDRDGTTLPGSHGSRRL